MGSNEPPLDEIAWSAPATAAQIGGQYRIHNNNVLFYFGESPFFDRTSNNQVVITQAQMPGRGHMIATRDAFEDELRKRSGLEFMVASSQMDYGNPDCAESNGRWVIRKQVRTKRDGQADGINVLATYFVIGETIYMAPSIAKILSGKLLSITESFNSFLTTAAHLPLYSAANGYHYVDPTLRTKDPVPEASRLPSRAASPGPASASQIDTQMTGSQDHFDSATEANARGTASATTDSQALYESFQVFSKYGDEHMDEDALAGEPGSFSFTSHQSTSTKSRLGQHQPLKLKAESRQSRTPQPLEKIATVKDETPVPEKPIQNGNHPPSPAPKVKRRKSKAPTNPSSPSSPLDIPTTIPAS